MSENEPRKAKPCPICDAPAEPKFRPFCSRRCADLDLGRWLKGAYAIPAVETDEPDDEGAEGR
jgi:endogenous inhibitor of DNA gyrase (YacG/DUF329 family)